MNSKRWRSLLARALRRILLHLDFVHSGSPDLRGSLRRLRDHHGLDPRLVIDVGAFEGRWSASVARVFPQAHFLLVEPQASKQEIIARRMERYRHVIASALLSDVAGRELSFFQMASGSSYKAELTPFPRVEHRLRTSTLDDVVAQSAPGEGSVLLKLDTQGSELDVLLGASAVMARASCVIIEMSLLHYNEGAPLAFAVEAFMQERGFALIDIVEVHRRQRDGAMLQFDGLFVPVDGELFTRLNRSHV